MARRFTQIVNLAHVRPLMEGDLEVTVVYDFTPGTPEVGRGYMADPTRYDPGSDPEFVIVSITDLTGQPVIVDPIEEEKVVELLVEGHVDDDGRPDPCDLRKDRLENPELYEDR